MEKSAKNNVVTRLVPQMFFKIFSSLPGTRFKKCLKTLILAFELLLKIVPFLDFSPQYDMEHHLDYFSFLSDSSSFAFPPKSKRRQQDGQRRSCSMAVGK